MGESFQLFIGLGAGTQFRYQCCKLFHSSLALLISLSCSVVVDVFSCSSSSPPYSVFTSAATIPLSFKYLLNAAWKPCVTKTFSAPVAFTTFNNPLQSAWSLNAKPASAFRLLTFPLTCIQPLHTPTL